MAAQPPRPKLPPLSALRAFEAAGRLGGFAPAALELGVTPGAVTAHLKTLESSLGVSLFERKHRGVELTDLGARVLPEFTAAFEALEAAVHALTEQAAPDLVRIATTPDLALLWLSPRLAALRQGGVNVVPVAVPSAEAARGQAELGLFIEEGTDGALVAVAAPELAASLASPADLRADACLTMAGPDGDWTLWSQAAGIPGFKPRGMVHGQAALALEEAANGAGVLVIAGAYAEGALKSGRVVALFGVEAPVNRGLTARALRSLPKDGAAERVLAQLR